MRQAQLVIGLMAVTSCADRLPALDHNVEARPSHDASVASDGSESSADRPESADGGVPGRRAACVAREGHLQIGAPREVLRRGPGDSTAVVASILQENVRSFAQELLIAEPLKGQVTWMRDCGVDCPATILREGLNAPVRARAADVTADGLIDLVVADIGSLPATTAPVGRVTLMQANNEGFQHVQLLENVGRVACAEPADLDGDADVDIAVCEFGAADGSILWLEQLASGDFATHTLYSEAGAIHAIPVDIDRDDDLDIAAAVSQSTQQVVIFRNDGSGRFNEEIAFAAHDEGFGLSGITVGDVNADEYPDILVTGGDYLDETFDLDQQGLWWLENDRTGAFRAHLVTATSGAHTVRIADLDRDCDQDIVLASWHDETRTSEAAHFSGYPLTWLENDGQESFEAHEIAGAPALTLAMALVPNTTGFALYAASFDPEASAQGVAQRMVAFDIRLQQHQKVQE